MPPNTDHARTRKPRPATHDQTRQAPFGTEDALDVRQRHPVLEGGTLHPRSLAVPCTLIQRDFDRFADLSGDHNPIHVDPHYAARTAFGATVAHGMLLYSRLRGLMAQTLAGCTLHTQDLMFPAPTYTDETLTLVLEVPTGASNSDDAIALRMQVRKPDGRLGLDGTAQLCLSNTESAPARGHSPPELGDTARHTPDMRAAAGLPAFQALRVGDAAHVTRHYRATDLNAWAALVQCATVPAQVPEPLIAALFSYLLGEKVPGHGTNYLKQTMTFHAAAYADEPLTARVTITRLRPDKALVNLRTDCSGADGRLVCSGQALVLFKC